MGRPTKKTPETVAEIIRRLTHGEPLSKICADDHMPDFSTVWDWEQKDEEFANMSARARQLGTHHMADDCIQIADEPGDPSDKRVRIDTRLRLIGMWNRKDYGAKQEVEHKGGVTVVTQDHDANL